MHLDEYCPSNLPSFVPTLKMVISQNILTLFFHKGPQSVLKPLKKICHIILQSLLKMLLFTTTDGF